MHEVKLIEIILRRVLFDDCAQLILSFFSDTFVFIRRTRFGCASRRGVFGSATIG